MLSGYPICLSDPRFFLWHSHRHWIELSALLNCDNSSWLDVFAFHDVSVFVYAIGWDADTSPAR